MVGSKAVLVYIRASGVSPDGGGGRAVESLSLFPTEVVLGGPVFSAGVVLFCLKGGANGGGEGGPTGHGLAFLMGVAVGGGGRGDWLAGCVPFVAEAVLFWRGRKPEGGRHNCVFSLKSEVPVLEVLFRAGGWGDGVATTLLLDGRCTVFGMCGRGEAGTD